LLLFGAGIGAGMTIKKWLLEESVRILNFSPSQKEKFFQWVRTEGQNIVYDRLYKMIIEQNQTLFLKLIIKTVFINTTDSELEKIANSSINVKDVFIRI